MFADTVFIVHMGMGSDFAEGHFISTQIYGHNPNSDNYNLLAFVLFDLKGLKVCLVDVATIFLALSPFFIPNTCQNVILFQKLFRPTVRKIVFVIENLLFQ